MSSERSQMYNSFRGRSKSKFMYGTKDNANITENNFFRWTDKNMYRTSYHDMSARVSLTFS